MIWTWMCTTRYIGFVVNILNHNCPYSSLYCLPTSSSLLQAIPAHVSFLMSLSQLCAITLGVQLHRGASQVPHWATRRPCLLEEIQTQPWHLGKYTYPSGSVQSWRPLIALPVVTSQNSVVSSGNAGESTTATQSILSPTVDSVQLPTLSLVGLF